MPAAIAPSPDSSSLKGCVIEGRFTVATKEAPFISPEKPALRADDVTFLLCIEANRLEPQGMLLCESIRTFGGCYANSSIVAISPRPSLILAESGKSRLRELGVSYVVEPLNTTGHPYGAINRIVAGAWAEANIPTTHIVVLDTDTMFLGEPTFGDYDVGIRPVDVKGSASSGPSDRRDVYWSRMCAFAGISVDRLPMIYTTVKHQLIRASFNAGFTIVRRSLDILQKTRTLFFQGFAENLRPRGGSGSNVLASTGFVGEEASEWWGSSQAALSVAIWSTTLDVRDYGPAYNIPLHLLAPVDRDWPIDADFVPIFVHYHYLTQNLYRDEFLNTLAKIGCRSERVDWVAARLNLFD